MKRATAGRPGDAAVVRIRRARTARDLESIVRISAEVSPHEPASVAEMRWAQRAYPGVVRLLAAVGGADVGTALTGRIYSYPPEFDAWWAVIEVLPSARRRGVGDRLYRAISRRARVAGKSAFLTPVPATSADGIAFLEHRGFVEADRRAAVRLDLAGLARPDAAPPPGVTITTLGARADLAPAVHAVAVTAWADIPSVVEAPQAGPYDEWVERELRGPHARLEAFFIALAGDEVAGFANLHFHPGRPTIAEHGMTGVARTWRGRGIASALKRAAIRWAIEAGLDALEASNDLANAPMRAINERLGYRRQPDELTMRGPLAPGRVRMGPARGPRAAAAEPRGPRAFESAPPAAARGRRPAGGA